MTRYYWLVAQSIEQFLQPWGSKYGIFTYIYVHLVDFYGFHVGKYTSPMDSTGNAIHLAQSQAKQTWRTYYIYSENPETTRFGN